MAANDPDRRGEVPSRALGSRKHDGGRPELDEATKERLGLLLERSAEPLVRQPVPEVFLLLLARMEAKERGE